jgi:hypothetical protein
MVHPIMIIFHRQNHTRVPYLDNLNLIIQYPLGDYLDPIRTNPYYPFIYSYILLLLILSNN